MQSWAGPANFEKNVDSDCAGAAQVQVSSLLQLVDGGGDILKV